MGEKKPFLVEMQPQIRLLQLTSAHSLATWRQKCFLLLWHHIRVQQHHQPFSSEKKLFIE